MCANCWGPKHNFHSTSYIQMISAFLCVFVIALALSLVGLQQMKFVHKWSGNLTYKTYDTFNYTTNRAACDHPYIPHILVSQKATLVDPVPVEHYHFYYLIELVYNNIFYNQTACSAIAPMMKSECSDGRTWESRENLKAGPTICDLFIYWNFDPYNATLIENNRKIWISTFPKFPQIYVYLLDPGQYGWNKVYASIPFFCISGICLCIIISQLIQQYRSRNLQTSSQNVKLLDEKSNKIEDCPLVNK